jgi:cysteine synthase A
MISKGTSGPHKIQGIGAGFIPTVLNQAMIDEVMTITDDEAFETTRLLAKTEGVLVGMSSGAALSAATKLALKEENKGKRIVVIMADTGERYMSTTLFE